MFAFAWFSFSGNVSFLARATKSACYLILRRCRFERRNFNRKDSALPFESWRSAFLRPISRDISKQRSDHLVQSSSLDHLTPHPPDNHDDLDTNSEGLCQGGPRRCLVKDVAEGDDRLAWCECPPPRSRTAGTDRS
jgi:hypothetical protein